MSPTDRQTLLRKLSYLQGTLEALAPIRQLAREEFFSDKRNLPLTERYMQIAIESVIDCSRLVVALKGWRRVREETDAWLIMARHGIITQELAERLSKARGFRNILVHEYAEIDTTLVHKNLQEGYGDLQEFAKTLASYLQEEKT